MELNALELEHEIGRYVSKYLYIESLGDISDNDQGGGGGGGCLLRIQTISFIMLVNKLEVEYFP